MFVQWRCGREQSADHEGTIPAETHRERPQKVIYILCTADHEGTVAAETQ